MYIAVFVTFLGSLVVNYPYDDDPEGVIRYSRSPDDAAFKMVALAYSQVSVSYSWTCSPFSQAHSLKTFLVF